MKQVPGFMLRHEVSVEPYLGTNAVGEVFGTKVAVKCHFVEATKMVRNASGEEVGSSAHYIAPPTHKPRENSRVTVPAGDTRKVVAVNNDTWPGMNVPANSTVYVD